MASREQVPLETSMLDSGCGSGLDARLPPLHLSSLHHEEAMPFAQGSLGMDIAAEQDNYNVYSPRISDEHHSSLFTSAGPLDDSKLSYSSRRRRFSDALQKAMAAKEAHRMVAAMEAIEAREASDEYVAFTGKASARLPSKRSWRASRQGSSQISFSASLQRRWSRRRSGGLNHPGRTAGSASTDSPQRSPPGFIKV